MTFCHLLLHPLRRSSLLTTITAGTKILTPTRSLTTCYVKVDGKCYCRPTIDHLLHALRREPNEPSPIPDPNIPRDPDTIWTLFGPRLSLHNNVQSLIRAGDLENASILARHSIFSETRPTVFTCNAIIDSMYRAKRYSDAIALFTYFFKQSDIIPDIGSYNILINTLCDNGEVCKALEMYEEILMNTHFTPSDVTYRHITKGLVDAGRIDEAVFMLRKMLNDGLGADSIVYNNLILGYLNMGNLDKANEFSDELKERCSVYDGIVSATFMEWFFSRGREREAMESYRELLMDKNFGMVPLTCNALLEVLLKYGKKDEALALVRIMLDNHDPPFRQPVNSDTLNILVNGCFKIGNGSKAYNFFKKAGKMECFAMDTAVYNNIISRYCENEMMEDAEKLYYESYVEFYDKSLSPDVNTYRILIDAYFKVGRVDDALKKFIKMVEVGLRVIPASANKWFSELIEKGKVTECAPILTKMAERELKPDALSYDMVIRELCRIGNFDASVDLLGQMVSHGVGVTPALQEFALETFDKLGRKEEIHRLLSGRLPTYEEMCHHIEMHHNP